MPGMVTGMAMTVPASAFPAEPGSTAATAKVDPATALMSSSAINSTPPAVAKRAPAEICPDPAVTRRVPEA